MVNYAEFKGGSSLSQPKKSFESSWEFAWWAAQGRAFWAEGTISTKIRD